MKRTSSFLVALFLLLFVCSLFLLTTESGLILMQKSVNRVGGDVLSIGQVGGRLLGDLSLTNIRVASADANINVGRVEYSWRPASLFKAELNIVRLAVAEVDIALKDSPGSAPASDAVELPAILLPFTVLLESFVVDKLAIIDSDGSDLFVVDRLIARLQGNGDRLTINEFDLQGPDIGLALHGNIEVHRGWALNVLGNWRFAGFGFHPMVGTFSTTGPLRAPHLELGIHSPGDIRVKADLVNLLEKPEWTAKLEAKDVDLSTLIEDCPKIDLATVKGDLAGDFSSYRGRVLAEGNWDKLEGMHLVSELTGDFFGIDFRSLRIDSKERSALADGGKISWQDIFSWEGRFLFKNFDPSAITDSLQGNLDADIASIGDVKENGVVASFEIFNLDGVLHDQKVSAVGKVFLTETDVHTDGLTIRSGDVAGVAYIENGFFSWAEEPDWSGEMRLEQFDPSWWLPEFPGSVNGEFKGEGALGENGLEVSLNIKKISGTLRGNEISGGGDITFSGDTLQTSGLVLQSGLSKLVVSGRAGDGLGLDFRLSSPDIGRVLPESNGSILLQGSLKGNRNEPQVDAELQATGLSYRENSLGKIQAELHAGLKNDGRLSVSILGEKISLAGLLLDKGSLKLTGNLADHQLVVDGSGAMGDLGFKVQGAYRAEWRGQLSESHVETQDYGTWRQEKKAAVTVGEDGIQFERFCLADRESSVCLGGDVQLAKELVWKAHGGLTSVPLKWLNRPELSIIAESGVINADFSANGNSQRVISAKTELKVSAVDFLVKAQESEMVPVHLDNVNLTLDLADALLLGKFSTSMRNGSQIVLATTIEGAGDFSIQMGSLPLRGNLELKEFDLAMLNAFTGYGVEPSGRVNNLLTLAGTVGQPKIYGEISILDGGIDLPYQGITLADIVLSIEAREEVAQITGKATSGPGKVTLVGTLRYGMKGVEGELNIHGNDFLLVNLPEYNVRVNPDVVLTFKNDEGELRGTIDVPFGLITPEAMSDSISVSEDVIFISGVTEERREGWPFKLDINVRLGDDVRIDGYGLTGKLEGELKVSTTPDDSLAGKGELDLVEGTFTIYGRTLRIERGLMLFNGGPLDNPGIDVRAQVKVSDEEAKGKGYTVGVDISGLVQDLKYRLFSDPFKEDTEILSLMIVGHSLANSTQTEGNILEAAAVTLGVQGGLGLVQGLGSLLFVDDLHLEGSSKKENVSLVVGKHVTEDLYIGYDLNMYSQLGQFRVRYDLTRGFSVETRSSSESTGADLLYSFER